MGRSKAQNVDAAQALVLGMGKAAALRQASDLEATEMELVAAAARGELTPKRERLKVFNEDGSFAWYARGERLPVLPPTHRLIAQRLVTTMARWQGAQAAKAADSYMAEAPRLRSELSHKAAAVQAIEAELAQLAAQTAAKSADLAKAQAALAAYQDKVLRFVEAAPLAKV